MKVRNGLIAPLAVCGALVLAGCVGTSATETGGPTSDGPVSDAVTCAAFGDVLTIVDNADAGLRDGRMEAQEQEGWYRLATRVLDRVPTSGDGAVSDAVLALRDIAPVISQGVVQPSGIQTDEWMSAQTRLVDACMGAGVDVAMEMFTGG
jgi:hypothetical protein